MRTIRLFATLLAPVLCPALFGAADCGAIKGMSLPNAAITSAELVTSGSITPPYGQAVDKLPPLCRVSGVSTPSSDSYIRFEVWLPVSGWNQKFLATGNGGFAGAIDYNGLARNVRHGYATAGTDTGHEADGVDASWAYQHPEKITDFGYRGLHETVQNAKKLTAAFYAQAPKHSYFDACSDGGREALMEAQRFPEDFDGILAGAPANYWTHMLAGAVDLSRSFVGNPQAYISARKLPAITAAALSACDAEDGVKDGVINNPAACRFDPSSMLCKGRDELTCLTAPQVESLKKLYSGAKDGRGRDLFPGFAKGGENGAGAWTTWLMGQSPGGGASSLYTQNYFRYMVFNDPKWNPLTADVDAAIHAADEKTARDLNATDVNLKPFYARGGKLIIYHGWNDPAISPYNSINYYNSVVATAGAEAARQFVRLYMVPGLQHCAGGPGASSFGQLGLPAPKEGIYQALESWVESGTEPAVIVAGKYADADGSKPPTMTRPICPYPQLATYKGSGDTNSEANFTCAAPGQTSAISTGR